MLSSFTSSATLTASARRCCVTLLAQLPLPKLALTALVQASLELVQHLLQLGLRPNLVSLRASILRWTQTLDAVFIADTFRICASLELSMDSGTVALVLRDTALAVAVRSAGCLAAAVKPACCAALTRHVQMCDFSSLLSIVDALQHLYRHAAEPSSELAYAQAKPLVPVLAAACTRALELLLGEHQKVQVRPSVMPSAAQYIG